jgi:hypothetical protein
MMCLPVRVSFSPIRSTCSVPFTLLDYGAYLVMSEPTDDAVSQYAVFSDFVGTDVPLSVLL